MSSSPRVLLCAVLETQLTFNFDSPPAAAAAEATEERSHVPPPLVRPDRQIVFPEASSHYDWPSPEALHDRDTITVDRIRDDIDGPSHRFIIRRGDTVEVFFSAAKQEIGEVTGISHARREVRVCFEGSEGGGIWLDAARIYPAAEVEPVRKGTIRLSEAVAVASKEPPGGFIAADQVNGTLPPAPSETRPDEKGPEADSPEPEEVAALKSQLMRHLTKVEGAAMDLRGLRRELGHPHVPSDPQRNPVNLAIRELRDEGRVHVEEARWGEPRVSVLTWPKAEEEWSNWNYPDRLQGPEVTRLMMAGKVTIKELSTRMQITQKRIRQVRHRGIEGRHTVRDWAEAILKPRQAVNGNGAAPDVPVASSNGTEERADTALSQTYTLSDHKAFRARLVAGEITAAELKAEFSRMRASHSEFVDALKAAYNARQLTNLAGNLGNLAARSNNKTENAEAVFRSLLSMFNLGGSVSYSPFSGETYEDALAKRVEATTDEQVRAFLEDRETRKAANEKALTRPETLPEFREFIRERGISQLSDEQLAAYDSLEADRSRSERAARIKTTVSQFSSPEADGLELRIIEGFHEKRQAKLWIVQLGDRVERSTFNELKIKARQLGGWWSSFVKAKAGFQFLEEESATKFAGLVTSDADRTDELHARKERREQSAAERLHELADSLLTKAEETVERSHESLQNTARRADIQAGVRGRAYADQALGRSLHSIAEALSRGEANYLDGIRHKTHVETLDTVLYLAKWARVRNLRKQGSESHFSHSVRLDEEEAKPVSVADIRYAEFPYPTVYRRHLEEAVKACGNKKGIKLLSTRMAKRLAGETGDYVTFTFDSDIEELSKFVSALKGASYTTDRVDMSLERFRRLQRANIHTVHELRAALREYLPHKASLRGDDPVLVAERELIGQKLPGFFPTPRTVIGRMLELAEVKPEHKILEPSCGKGDILDAIRSEVPEADVTAIELNRTLAEVLSAKGHDVDFADFLEHRGTYDRIVMNPPFERGEDIAHVRHAYQLLAPGGRLVSIMSEGPFFRGDAKATEFREWLDELDGTSESLPEDAFQGSEAFRETGVRTRLVVIDR